MGGQGLVETLGPNFLTWFNNFQGYDYGTTPKIVVPGLMTKVQQSVPSNGSILNSQYCYRSYLNEAPSSDEFVTGNDNNNWDTVWVFKKPLVISYVYGGTTYHASFYSQFTNPN